VLLRRWFPLADAAAIAATYGSVSAVTFVTATGYLDMLGIQWSGYLVAAMALMESPAIIVGIVLYKYYGGQQRGAENSVSWKALLREALFNGSVLLILGSMLIGWITGAEGMQKVEPLVKDLFLGLLCLFLLDMGIVAARRFGDLPAKRTARSDGRSMRPLLLAAMLLPALNALVGLALAVFLGLSEGNALLLVVLAASASYIAVPAAMRLALPEANPGSYLTMSLAITFPLNLLVGIPAYHAAIRWLL
jgi:hypothetical protein